MLTQDYINSVLRYDDGKLFWKQTMNQRAFAGKFAGALRARGDYLDIQLKGKKYRLHRLVFFMFNGWWPTVVDHIDGNTLNNRIENLRAATQLQNIYNSRIRKRNTSGHKNVSWSKRHKKWIVTLMFDGRSKRFGAFEDLELAALVATEARDKYHGEFARHA